MFLGHQCELRTQFSNLDETKQYIVCKDNTLKTLITLLGIENRRRQQQQQQKTGLKIQFFTRRKQTLGEDATYKSRKGVSEWN